MTVNRGENNGSLMNPKSFLLCEFPYPIREENPPVRISRLDAVPRVLHNGAE